MHKANAPQRETSGFTLIELLIVVAIIAIISAILFPVFATAREKGRQTACASNEKQICLALLAYAQDYDETFPLCWSIETSYSGYNVGWSNWDQLLTPYYKVNTSNYSGSDPQVLACPDDVATRKSTVYNGKTYNGNQNGTYRSYGLAGAYDSSTTPSSYAQTATPNEGALGFAGPIMTGYGKWIFQSGHQQSQLPAPAQLLMLVEMPGYFDTVESNGAVCYRPDTDPSASDYTYACNPNAGGCGQNMFMTTYPDPSLNGVHSGGWNYGFADGHVKWLLPQQTVSSSYRFSGWGSNPGGYWSLTGTTQ